MKKTVLTLFTFLTFFIAHSQTILQSGIEYTVTSTTANTVSVTSYNNGGVANKNVVIPSTITVNASSKSPNLSLQSTTYTVTKIGFGAFDNKSIASIIIPNTVTTIENNAFRNNALTTVDLPDGLTIIGSYLFHQNALTSVNIPSGVTAIYPNAFSSNDLTDIIFPEGLTLIGSGSFIGNNLTSVTIPSSVTEIQISAFVSNPITCVISKAITAPILNSGTGGDSFSNLNNIDLSIPTGTTGAYVTDAGALWTGFKSVAAGLTSTFVVDNITYQINANPNNEVTVKDYNTAGGTAVVIPGTVSSACTVYSVTDIGLNAFRDNQLNSVSIPISVINIGETAFAYNDLPNVTIPDNVVTLGDGAFAQNNNMVSAVIGTNVTTIGEYVFRYNNLNSVTIPDSVTTIGAAAFGNNSITNLDLGSSVTNIGFLAFGYNQLASVVIPANVTFLGKSVFNNNPLTAIYSEALTPAIITTGVVVDDTFYFRNSIHLHIPANTMGVYVTDSGALWTGFASVTEDALLSTSNFQLANDIRIAKTLNEIKIISADNVTLKSYAIYTLLGVKVSKGKSTRISTNSLSKGIYVLKLNFNKGTFTKKVLVD